MTLDKISTGLLYIVSQMIYMRNILIKGVMPAAGSLESQKEFSLYSLKKGGAQILQKSQWIIFGYFLLPKALGCQHTKACR